MKSFKATLTTAFFAAICCQLIAQNTAEKTLVKSFNLQGNQEVLLDLSGEVSVQEWNNDIMRVQVTISIPNGSEAMLKSLVRAGRYNLRSKLTKDNSFLVYAPRLDREIKMNGQVIREKLSYLIYAPSKVVVRQANEASTSVVRPDEKTSTL